MRVSLEAGDRTLLMVAGLLLVATTIAGMLLMPSGSESKSLGFPSSYSTSSDGAKAAYLLLAELGYRVERWINPPDQLPDPANGTVLVLADPFIGTSADERWQIGQFIRRGGRVLFTGTAATSLLPAANIKGASKLDFDWREFRAQLPGPLSRQAVAVSMKTFSRWGSEFPNYVPYFGDEQGAVVVTAHLGQGELIWWASSSPLTNYGLTRAANLQLFLNSLGPPEETRVLWDEYYHGVRAGFWDYLGRTPVPWALAQMGVLFLAVILTFSRRSGPIAIHPEGSRLSPLEFVETVGDLYERKHAAAGALEVAFNRFRSVLERRLGLPSPASMDAIQRIAHSRLGRSGPALFQTLQQCQQAVARGRITNQEALGLVQSLHEHTRCLWLGRIGG